MAAAQLSHAGAVYQVEVEAGGGLPHGRRWRVLADGQEVGSAVTAGRTLGTLHATRPGLDLALVRFLEQEAGIAVATPVSPAGQALLSAAGWERTAEGSARFVRPGHDTDLVVAEDRARQQNWRRPGEAWAALRAQQPAAADAAWRRLWPEVPPTAVPLPGTPGADPAAVSRFVREVEVTARTGAAAPVTSPGTWRVGDQVVRAVLEQIAPDRREDQPAPLVRSIYALAKPGTDSILGRDGRLVPNEAYIRGGRPGGRYTTPAAVGLPGLPVTVEALCEAYNSGKRWIDVSNGSTYARSQDVPPFVGHAPASLALALALEERRQARGDTGPAHDERIARLLVDAEPVRMEPGESLSALVADYVEERTPGFRLSGWTVQTDQDAAAAFAALRSPFVERLSWIVTDRHGAVVGSGIHSIGTLTSSDALVDPSDWRDIAAAARGVEGASLWIAHNHPSGNPTPSASDIQAYQRMRGQAKDLGMAFQGLVTNGERYAVVDPSAWMGFELRRYRQPVHKAFEAVPYGQRSIQVKSPEDAGLVVKLIETAPHACLGLYCDPHRRLLGVTAYATVPSGEQIRRDLMLHAANTVVITGDVDLVRARELAPTYPPEVVDVVRSGWGGGHVSLAAMGLLGPAARALDPARVRETATSGTSEAEAIDSSLQDTLLDLGGAQEVSLFDLGAAVEDPSAGVVRRWEAWGGALAESIARENGVAIEDARSVVTPGRWWSEHVEPALRATTGAPLLDQAVIQDLRDQQPDRWWDWLHHHPDHRAALTAAGLDPYPASTVPTAAESSAAGAAMPEAPAADVDDQARQGIEAGAAPGKHRGKPPGKHQDVGEKLGGARKDLWRRRGGLVLDDLATMNEAEKLTYIRKEEIWPSPDWQALAEAGHDPGVLLLVKRMRDAIDVAPDAEGYSELGRSERFAHYTEHIGNLRQRIEQEVLTTPAPLRAQALNALRDIGEGFAAVPHAHRLTRLTAIREHFRMSHDIEYAYNRAQAHIQQTGWPSRDQLDANAWRKKYIAQPTGWTEAKEPGGQPVRVWRIHERVGKRRMRSNPINDQVFTNREDAEAWCSQWYKEQLQAKRSQGHEAQITRPLNDDPKRVGPDFRNGKDVTGDDLLATFGFRGVEFGNWTNQADRQQHLNFAYDSFMDLADLLGVPPKAISLYGELGIAFGARGGGRFSAHYEPTRVVINLTRTRGAGSTAHEWWHAVDDYFCRLDKYGSGDSALPSNMGDHVRFNFMRREIAEAWSKLNRRIDNRIIPAEDAVKAWDASIAQRTSSLERWKSHYESAIGGREQMPADVREAWDRAWMDFYGVSKASIEDDTFYRANEVVTNTYREGLARLDQRRGQGANPCEAVHIARMLAQEREIADLVRTGVRVVEDKSQFAAISTATGEYWARPHEKFARVGESWVFDRLEAKGRRNDYLVHSVKGDPSSPWGKLYPIGDERRHILAAMDSLVATWQVTEDATGRVKLHEAQDPYWARPMSPIEATRALAAMAQASAIQASRRRNPDAVAPGPADFRQALAEVGLTAVHRDDPGQGKPGMYLHLRRGGTGVPLPVDQVVEREQIETWTRSLPPPAAPARSQSRGISR